MRYLEATNELYQEAALSPEIGLYSTPDLICQQGLSLPEIMQEMSYGSRRIRYYNGGNCC